jgi:hypothetical protein
MDRGRELDVVPKGRLHTDSPYAFSIAGALAA